MAEPEHDPRTVLVTDTMKVAEKVIELLASEGIAAEIVISPAKPSSDPLTGMTEPPADEIEVRVSDPSKAAAAKKQLGDAQQTALLREIRDQRANRTGTVTAVCEECGQSSEWPAAAMGTTENCPNCTAYMDIPDPDDDWSDVDFGSPEGEDEGEGETK